jgi:alpha-galactosidase
MAQFEREQQMILEGNGFFCLMSANTSYCFHVLPSGHLEHLYYGAKLTFLEEGAYDESRESLRDKCAFLKGNLIAYSEEYPQIGLETTRLEVSSLGKGDVREPFLEIEYADGSRTSDFVYDSHRVEAGKSAYDGLPSAYGDSNEVTTLTVVLRDRHSGLILELDYHVFYAVDVITKSARLINPTDSPVRLNRFMSSQVDFDHSGYVLSTFSGAWTKEMQKTDVPCTPGTHSLGSMSGVSSNRMNPFFMVSESGTSERYGNCYGFNLIYSGNHYGAVEVNGHHTMRVLQGIHPTGFCYEVAPKCVFQAPESVMTFSSQGHRQMSAAMHRFVRQHIVRGHWQYLTRPILLNSWEAAYFDFNEKKLLKLAKAAKQVGVELFVMDDGWFGQRHDDTQALGDWEVNKDKLPNGVQGLSKKIRDMGLLFGIWVEPEMISENSECYRAHPDWAVKIPDRHHSLGRHQCILDLTREDVQEFVIASMSKVFSGGAIDYVKWDMNRIFSDVYSPSLPAHRQGEFAHRYVLGLYRVMGELVSRFPKILFESCASGGNRFDLGMLCYMPQIWASDNTDALSRMSIQNGYSYGYPLSVMGAHVSDCPNHQTLRETPLSTRFHVASFGLLGYECNLVDFSSEALKAIRGQIEVYKSWRRVFQFGQFYRLVNPTLRSGYNWMVVSEDQSRAVSAVLQTLAEANPPSLKLICTGLKEDWRYRVHNLPESHDVRLFGDLINMISPVHIKKDSLTHQMVAKFYKLSGEQEGYSLSGSVLNHAGIYLKQGFSGVGFNEQIRVFPDFASRMYFIEKID